ncbi:myotubularin-related protein 14-like isoform X2 [Liolophura sinensis]|uniref:myotubularin-related protein 14-like isoform X2 n=1 Tax=Liolophura sinensis TaxID=3198878 RepID=UPI003159697D
MARHRAETRPEDIHHLLDIFVKAPFRAKESDRKTDGIIQKCLDLFGRDYEFAIINNTNGELCGTYPTKLVVLEYERPITSKRTGQDGVENLYDMNKIGDLLKQARRARCRARCVIPVILFEGKHICRSATLSSGAEIYGRSGLDFFFASPDSNSGPAQPGTSQDMQNDWQLYNRVRGQDIQLLKTLNVGYICDLMVEKKKVKFGMNITSSEKVDKEQRYNDFDIFSVPYPGCEFFRKWKDSGYETDHVLFDWSQGYVDACLDIPPIPLMEKLGVDWNKYKNWNLLKLTQNYVKLLLHLLHEGNQGVLVHCISGWDRTPMFVSLLRLSLWADGLIHKSLSATEILYLTIAYDWFLFGHDLTDRLQKGEEILYFCFHFLKFIASEEFSLKRTPTPNMKQRKGSQASNISETDCHIDGILLDSDSHVISSHTSSNSSLNSGSSGIDTGGSMGLDTGSLGITPTNIEPALTNGSLKLNMKRAGHVGSVPAELSAHYSAPSSSSSSSPMPVPINRIRNTEAVTSQSPVSGRCSEVTEEDVSVRWQRLNNVWRLFSNAYANKISVRYGTQSTGLGAFLDRFTERVGIRNNPI